MKILEEFIISAWAESDGEVRLDLDCSACKATVFTVEAYVITTPLHGLITAASNHKKVCPNGPLAALDAMRGGL